jgi:hypothetical protein
MSSQGSITVPLINHISFIVLSERALYHAHIYRSKLQFTPFKDWTSSKLQAITLLLVGFILHLLISPSLFLKPLQLFSGAIQSCLVFFILYLTLAFPNALSFRN